MGRSKAPSGYPTVYAEVIEAVLAKNETLEIPCETNKQAQLTRFQFYSFIKACRKSQIKREKDLGEAAYGLVFSIHKEILSVSIRDTSNDAMRIKNSLQEYLGAPTMKAAHATGASAAASSYHPPQIGLSPSDAQEDMISSFMKGGKK